MDPIKDIDMPGEEPGAAEFEDSFSVEDFLRQLEERERDLHISADMEVEIDESPLDEIPAFLLQDLAEVGVRAVEPHVAPGLSEKEAEVERLESRVQVLQTEVSRKEVARVELAEMLRRRQTDFDNFKKRVERDREEQQMASVAGLVRGLLPVIDNLDRALDFAGPVVSGRSEEFKQFFEGISLVKKEMLDVMQSLGVEAVPAVGEVFDPSVHDAVAVEESGVYPPNTVSTEMRRGYRLGDLVIRAAMVKVASAPVQPVAQVETVPSVAPATFSETQVLGGPAPAPPESFDESMDEDILDLGLDDSRGGF